MAIALGLAFIAVGLLFGYDRRFSNWGMVAVLSVTGALLAAGALLVPERHLNRFFAFCLMLNIAATAYAVLYPPPAH